MAKERKLKKISCTVGKEHHCTVGKEHPLKKRGSFPVGKPVLLKSLGFLTLRFLTYTTALL
ncbi:MAG: hypothetical protein PF690_05405 [Deltaproteobacteria bacterium]|jgi:hypothetical protein|nr:hypothetical protein [Deltaproteobacteria bacterium]